MICQANGVQKQYRRQQNSSGEEQNSFVTYDNAGVLAVSGNDEFSSISDRKETT